MHSGAHAGTSGVNLSADSFAAEEHVHQKIMNIFIKNCCYLMIFFVADVYATNFEFNYNPHGTGMTGGFIVKGQTSGGDSNDKGNDGTRFIQDTINIGGKDYFHVVIDDANSDFRQESYTDSVLQSTGPNGVRSFSTSGGNERSLIGDRNTVSFDAFDITAWPRRRLANAKSPLGYKFFSSPGDTGTVLSVDQRYKLSGNGTIDPSRVVLRLEMTDASVSVTVDKSLLDRKPIISQALTEGTLDLQFSADMTGSTYADATVNAPMTNTLILTDPDLPVPGGADFDINDTAVVKNSNITAGKFVYAPGGGWSAPTDPTGAGGWDVDGSTFDPGTYTYSEGGFDVLNVDWRSFFESAQNPNSLIPAL